MNNFIPPLDPELELKDVILKLKQFDDEFLNESFRNPIKFKQTIDTIVKSLNNILENIKNVNKDDLQT